MAGPDEWTKSAKPTEQLEVSKLTRYHICSEIHPV